MFWIDAAGVVTFVANFQATKIGQLHSECNRVHQTMVPDDYSSETDYPVAKPVFAVLRFYAWS